MVKCTDDGSYLCLKLKCVVQGCLDMYFCIHHKLQKNLYRNPDAQSPYVCLQDDALQLQGTGAELLICGNRNARTAERDHLVKLSELPECQDAPTEAEDLPSFVPARQQCD